VGVNLSGRERERRKREATRSKQTSKPSLYSFSHHLVHVQSMASWELSPLCELSLSRSRSLFVLNLDSSPFPELDRHSTSSLLPSQPLVLSSHHSKLILRHSTTLQIIRTWSLLLSSQSSTSTSKDSNLSFSISPLTASATASQVRILVYTSDRSTAWVLDPDKDEPIANLDIGGEECQGFEWSWDGNSILCWSAHRVRFFLLSIKSNVS